MLTFELDIGPIAKRNRWFWGIGHFGPYHFGPYHFGPFGPFWKRHFGPSTRHFGPSSKDTSAPSKRHFGPQQKTLRPLFFREVPLRPLGKMFFKLSKLLIFLKQMIKRISKVVKTSAFDYELVIFSAHEYIIIRFMIMLFTQYI